MMWVSKYDIAGTGVTIVLQFRLLINIFIKSTVSEDIVIVDIGVITVSLFIEMTESTLDIKSLTEMTDMFVLNTSHPSLVALECKKTPRP